MLFPRRTWAIRIVERTGLSIRSPEATKLIGIIVLASKELAVELEVAIGRKLQKAEAVLLAANAASYNISATLSLGRDLGLAEDDARALTARLRPAVTAVAAEAGFTTIVETLDQRR